MCAVSCRILRINRGHRGQRRDHLELQEALSQAEDNEALPFRPACGLQPVGVHFMIDPYIFPSLLPIATPPSVPANGALFLDLDGTLLDIAATPDSVAIPGSLVSDLSQAASRLDGAVAIVSGRILDEVDRLLHPLRLPGAGEHGAVIRMANGQSDEIDDRVPHDWVDALLDAARSKKGTLIERKSHSVVAHFRQAPRHEGFFKELCNRLVSMQPDAFEVLPGRMAVEIRSTRVNKGRAVHRLMKTPPFKGRVPIFVGDDVTDIDGFKAAEALGGQGADVFVRFAGRPAEVRSWLRTVPNA
jgi:trehalose 6-phosphate phosphatase